MPQMQSAPQPQQAQAAATAAAQQQDLARSAEARRRAAGEEAELQAQFERRRKEEVRSEAVRAARERELEVAQRAEEVRIQTLSDETYLEEQWRVFGLKKLDLPPQLLPLEAEQAYEQFKAYAATVSMRKLQPQAYENFRLKLQAAAAVAHERFAEFERAFKWSSLLTLGPARALLRNAKVSLAPPLLAPPGKDALQAAQRVLRSAWASDLPRSEQAIICFHKSHGKTVLQIGAGEAGFIYLTFDTSITPEELAASILNQLARPFDAFAPANGLIALYDGAHQKLNPKTAFGHRRIVRMMKDDPKVFLHQIAGLCAAEAPSVENTALEFAYPATSAELAAVFEQPGLENEADWDLWRDVDRDWRMRARRRGFPTPEVSASSESTLRALTQKKNVIIVSAHADGTTLHLPAPPPKGSTIGPEKLHEYADAIRANRPVVYLFCCETAEVENLQGFASHLLDCGAAAVVAPQTKINVNRAAALFEAVLTHDKATPRTLERLQKAERQSRYREMEVWLG